MASRTHIEVQRMIAAKATADHLESVNRRMVRLEAICNLLADKAKIKEDEIVDEMDALTGQDADEMKGQAPGSEEDAMNDPNQVAPEAPKDPLHATAGPPPPEDVDVEESDDDTEDEGDDIDPQDGGKAARAKAAKNIKPKGPKKK
jgi:hypothetical protein